MPYTHGRPPEQDHGLHGGGRGGKEPLIFRDEQTIKFSGGGIAYSVLSRDHKNEQCVLILPEEADDSP